MRTLSLLSVLICSSVFAQDWSTTEQGQYRIQRQPQLSQPQMQMSPMPQQQQGIVYVRAPICWRAVMFPRLAELHRQRQQVVPMRWEPVQSYRLVPAR
jgi:hypothetical protein